MSLSKVELVRQALQELKEASSHELAGFIERRYGVRIEARFIPIVRASIVELEMLEKARQATRAATAKEHADGVSEAIAASPEKLAQP